MLAAAAERHRAHMDKELAGVEALTGTYPFTLERSVKAYRLNHFLHELVHPAHRQRFLADEEACMAEAPLSDEERAMVRQRDWRALIQYGVIFFMLEKLGAVVGVSNLHIYAAMRGETLEGFQKTRNTKALYSVAGTDAGALGWDAPGKG
jgi:gallate dioxygenase